MQPESSMDPGEISIQKLKVACEMVTDQNSSTKVLQNIIAPNCTIWSSELNQKGFSCCPA